MSFCQMKLKNNYKAKKSSLKASKFNYHDSPEKNRKTSPLLHKDRILEVSGSMTIEAALLLPVLLFFMANILSLFVVYGQYSQKLALAHQNVRSDVKSYYGTYSGNKMSVRREKLPINPLYDAMGFESKKACVYAQMRKWTGYDLSGDISDYDIEEYVYVTQSGSVYHRSRSCSHLNVHIRVCEEKDIQEARNENGATYSACEKCARGIGTGVVFISRLGNRYHYSADCSSLKRTINTVSINDVVLPSCSECGG